MPPASARNIHQNSSFHKGQLNTQKLDRSKSSEPGPLQVSSELRQEIDDQKLGSKSLPLNAGVVDQGICSTFQDAHHFSVSGNARIVAVGQQNVINRGTYGLDTLEKFVLFSALHDSSAQDPERCCHPGTRESVLAQMKNWTNDPTRPERILWLHGPAGVGKSAIAQTISYTYGRDKVGATFFFFRSDPMRNDGNRLFPTIAWQLAFSVPIIQDLTSSALEEGPDLPRKTVEIQFDRLIARPFHSISGGESPSSSPSRVIIIDGLDECSDVKLQRRILRIIGNAVANARFPLRFIISSRTEAHIEDFFAKFQSSTLQIDLADIDSAYRDIEVYLTSEFAWIADDQELDPEEWPGRDSINVLVSKSSGQFVYASTVIKYVDDDYESAVTRLDIILGLKPITGKSPFSELDALYTEILQRQSDQDFLGEFLLVLVARSMLVGIPLDNFDEAMLLGLEEKEMDRKLRGMHSLLRFTPTLDVYHKSFLDFLRTSSRSGKYYVCNHLAKRRYMQLIVAKLISAASRAMDGPNPHDGDHFNPRFSILTEVFPLHVELPLDDLEEILQPLVIIQENLLQFPHMSVPACHKCWTFDVIDNLFLHLVWIRAVNQSHGQRYNDLRPLTAIEEELQIPVLDSDVCLSLLFSKLRDPDLSLNMEAIGLVRALVRFDPTEIAMQIQSISDAQNLVDLVFCLKKNQCFDSWFGAAAYNATRLAMAIYGRVPVLPCSFFLDSKGFDSNQETYQGEGVKISSRLSYSHVLTVGLDAFLWANLCHPNILPLLGVCMDSEGTWMISQISECYTTLSEWRQNIDPSISEIKNILLEVAQATQYIHLLGILKHYFFSANMFYLDSNNHPKVAMPSYAHLSNTRWPRFGDYSVTAEDNIYWFGEFFYSIIINEDIILENRPENHPKEPNIPDYVWKLIQWCCAKNPKERPTINQVVQEMESWV